MSSQDPSFEWDDKKASAILLKDGVSFVEAQEAFLDPWRIIATNERHSLSETRYFCIGQIARGIVTVRFTWRDQKIRIIGAGFWREGKKLYENREH